MNHEDAIKESFRNQAAKFATYHMSKAEYTNYLIQRIQATGNEHALEVAAGTAICGRALAPYVKDITCLDLTEEMLVQGKKLAEEGQIKNISLESGDAEALPYESESFDLVVTRLSLHHFLSPEKPFREMERVLKKGGKLIVWDMEATEEALREIDDKIERMRDPSHTRILSREEMKSLFSENFVLQCEELAHVPVNLESWMNLTDTPDDTRESILRLMQDDLSGGPRTGFYPYIQDSQIMFHHRWLLLIGIKK